MSTVTEENFVFELRLQLFNASLKTIYLGLELQNCIG